MALAPCWDLEHTQRHRRLSGTRVVCLPGCRESAVSFCHEATEQLQAAAICPSQTLNNVMYCIRGAGSELLPQIYSQTQATVLHLEVLKNQNCVGHTWGRMSETQCVQDPCRVALSQSELHRVHLPVQVLSKTVQAQWTDRLF